MAEFDDLLAENITILAEFGKESDIPIYHKYWQNKSYITNLHNQAQAEMKTGPARLRTPSRIATIETPEAKPTPMPESIKPTGIDDDFKF